MSRPDRLGRYHILGLLGSGAMGDVYLAEDPQIERRLAIKTVRLGGSDDDVEERKQRLLREAKAAGKLIHPHVVTLFDYGEDQGVVYLAFEYVEGEDLRQRIDREPPLTVREALTLVRQTADALAAAHRHSIVHRDIKPANILLTASGDAKVTDFGIAKLRDQASNLTMSGSIIGTPHYMSPEQVMGEPLDGRSDLFSLGAVLFEMLHGARAFHADSLTTVVYLILHHDPFEAKRPDLPAPLVALLERMLAKDNEQRFARGEEVVAEIDRILAQLPAEQLGAPATGPSPPDPAAQEKGLLGATTPISDVLPGPPAADSGAPSPDGPPRRTAGPPAWSGGSTPRPPAHPPAPAPAAAGSGSASSSTSRPPAPPPAAAPPAGSGSMPPTPVGAPAGAGTVSPPVPATAGTAAIGPGTRSRVWWLFGCLALPLLIGAGVLALAYPRAKALLDERRAAREVDPATSVDEREAGGGVETGAAPDRESGADRAEDGPEASPLESSDPSAPPGDRAAESDDDASATPRRDPPAAGEPAGSSGERQARAAPTRREADPPVRDDPPARRPATPPAEPVPSEPNAGEDEPRASEPEPVPEREDRRTVQSVPHDSELDSSLRLSFQVEPEEAFVLLRSAYDQRFTVVGQARDYDASKRRGEPFALPSDGLFYVMVRAEGFADHVVRVNADPARGGVTTLSLRMGRPGQRATTDGGSSVRQVSVREGITFADGPRRAQVEVDGREVGPLRRYQGGNLLRLDPGRHRVVVTQGSQRFELDVEVSAGASSDRQVVTIGSGD